MNDQKIRAKYGGKLPKAINRAIRAELPGGNEALDKLTQLAGAARQSGWKDRGGNATAEASAYFQHKRDVIDKMTAEIRRRWSVPPEETSERSPKQRIKTSGKQSPRKRLERPGR